MIQFLLELDRDAFLLINGLHTPWLDSIMVYASRTVSWIPLYLLLLYRIGKTYRTEGWIILIGIAMTILISDQVTSGLMKPIFLRPRPSWDTQLSGLVYIIDGYRGGQYGFPSSHAANTFGTTLFLWFVFRKRWIMLLFIWPLIVGYSRIYLGVHYPGDVIGGWITGALCAWLIYKLYLAMALYLKKRKTSSV